MTILLGLLWSLLAVRVGRLTDLDDEERRQLGTAGVPVFRKYAAIFGGWEAELTLLIVAGGLVVSHIPPKDESNAVEVDETGAPVPPEPAPRRGLWGGKRGE